MILEVGEPTLFTDLSGGSIGQAADFSGLLGEPGDTGGR